MKTKNIKLFGTFQFCCKRQNNHDENSSVGSSYCEENDTGVENLNKVENDILLPRNTVDM